MGIESSAYSGGQLITKYDNSKIFLFDNSFEDGQINNSTYLDVTHPVGTLMGRISATGLLIPLESAASDGSQYPVGVLATDYLVEDGTTADVRLCTGGEIDGGLLVLQGADTLDTVIDGRQLRDRIAADTVGLVLRTVDELGAFDNE